MRVLYVEDDPITQSAMIRRLHPMGHEVTVFDNSNDAMGFLDLNEPELLLTDYDLGESPNGLSLADYARKHYSHCAIILISSHDPRDLITKAKTQQIVVDDFIKKPVSGDGLAAHIEPAIKLRRA